MDDFAKEVITKMETYEKKEKRQFNKYDMAIGLFYGVGIFLGIGIFFVGGFMTMSGAGWGASLGWSFEITNITTDASGNATATIKLVKTA